jgi:hypothetical protein
VTVDEASVLVARMRGTWPRMYLVGGALDVWHDFFSRRDFATCVAALQKLAVTFKDPPAIYDFAQAIDGDRSQKFKCPTCGIGHPSPAGLSEHFDNVHWRE